MNKKIDITFEKVEKELPGTGKVNVDGRTLYGNKSFCPYCHIYVDSLMKHLQEKHQDD